MPAVYDMNPVERRLLLCLRTHKLSGASLLIAFSGGPDSTALLRAAEAVSEVYKLKVFAVWVDHGIRPDAERVEERRFVESLTERLGIPLDIAEAPVDETLVARAHRLGTSVEAEARDFRYEALCKAAGRFGCSRILTAHTADDQAETLLFRVLSGAGTAGLRGIPEDRPPFLRPFLALQKAELLRYLEGLGQDWRMDSTNATDEYARNRIRLDLIPGIEKAFPGFRSALFALAQKSSLDEELLSRLTQDALPVSQGSRESSFPADAFFAAHPALRLRALISEAGRLMGEGVRVPYALVCAAAIADPPRNDEPAPLLRILAEGAGLRFVLDGSSVKVVSLVAGEKANSDVTWGSGFAFLFEDLGTARIDSGGLCKIYLRLNGRGPALGTFTYPLVVRSRRPGDRIVIRQGYKPVDELLAELDIDPERRDFTPVLEDNRGIVAVMGSARGGRDRYRHYPGSLDPSLPRLVVELTGFGPFSGKERSAEAT
jgi:tRNA(Ile)-lysidine synthetase-like protein